MKIYVVDGEYETLKQIETLINHNSNYTAKCFTNAQRLIDAIRLELPVVTIIDYDLPNSIEMIEMIQNISLEIKIVLMSFNPKKAVEIYRYNLNGFLLKPIVEERVKELINKFKYPLLAKVKERN